MTWGLSRETPSFACEFSQEGEGLSGRRWLILKAGDARGPLRCSWYPRGSGEQCFAVWAQLAERPRAGVTNQMSIDELSPCEEEALPSPAEDEHNQNGNLD